MKKLSIIIPVYNSAKYLEECLKSICPRINNEVEIIIINDGSTDNSKEIYNKFKDENVMIIENENHGVSYTRNYGIDKANGKYVMFVDSDDVLSDNWFKLVNSQLQQDSDVVYFSQKLDGNITKNQLANYIIGNNNLGICIAGPFSKIYNRNFLNKNSIRFKEDVINGEDMLFNIEVCCKAINFNTINESFYLYRSNIGSATKRFDKRIVNTDMQFHMYLSNILSNSKFDLELIESILNYCKVNGIITILDRISYIKNFKSARQEYDFLNLELYSKIIRDYNRENNKKDRFILKMCFRNKYTFLFYYFKSVNNIKNLIRKRFDFIQI